MEVRVGDTLELKKPHPCGDSRFLVTRVGMDFKLRCLGCGRELLAPRGKIEKRVKRILPAGKDETDV